MPHATDSFLARALRAARQPQHTDDDIAAVLAALDGPEVEQALSPGGASTMLDVAEELRTEGTTPTFGAFGARISERAVGYRRRRAP
jgi:hypothetical protein